MVVKVERCSNCFRLTIPNIGREFVSYALGDFWSRAHSIEALNILERVYGFKRSSVRFEHIN